MNLFVNQNLTSVPDTCSLSQLIAQLKINDQGIALAIGQEVIAKKNWDTHQLQENDSIIIIKATQGG